MRLWNNRSQSGNERSKKILRSSITHNCANEGKFSKAPSRIAFNEFPDKFLKKERKKTLQAKVQSTLNFEGLNINCTKCPATYKVNVLGGIPFGTRSIPSQFTRKFFPNGWHLHFVGHCLLPWSTASSKIRGNIMIEACLTEQHTEKAKDTTRKLCFDARSILGSRSWFSIDLCQIALRLYLKLPVIRE